MDGTEVARRMREIETDGVQSIIIAVTAYCTAEDRQMCLASGMDVFLGKPMTPEKLRRALVEAARKILGDATSKAKSEIPNVFVSAPSLLDSSRDGVKGGLDQQIEGFLSSVSEANSKLQRELVDRNFDGAVATARVLNAQSKMVGAAGLTSIGAMLEGAIRRGDMKACGGLLPQVQTEISRLADALRGRRISWYKTPVTSGS